jgi:hypothetical protein
MSSLGDIITYLEGRPPHKLIMSGRKYFIAPLSDDACLERDSRVMR